MSRYQPPFTITPPILNLVIEGGQKRYSGV